MKSILTLFVVCVVCSGILAGVYFITGPKIEELSQKNSWDMSKKMFSSMVASVDSLKVKTVDHDGTGVLEVYDGDSLIGVNIPSYTDKGYGGRIDLLVGIKDCQIVDFEILKDSETPGLGSRAKEPEFKLQFRGKNLVNFNWKVKKDGGDIDGITSATITSRAVSEGINSALTLYSKYYGGCSNE